MCNGHSSRTSKGGAVAILNIPFHQKISSRSNRDEELQCDILFNNQPSRDADDASTPIRDGPTGATLRFRNSPPKEGTTDRWWVLIHRDGDLRNSGVPDPHPFYSFPILSASPTLSRESGSMERAVTVPDALDLSVGGKGIIGRRVSVVRDLKGKGETLMEGIIGYN
ncbi:hypothetical protein M501DRAFT_1059431 [Patellaria atrata CBS 101060]|uniref:Uncharacterized protein n=1 Tax=Patellaria atrata CBS 101060 TaxID=1346257 RepID=A0A9P4S6B5_9PEZI|nr:hypothetical protein M501DRAFT_1059431 [Patellaria atrata CBS 101060]